MIANMWRTFLSFQPDYLFVFSISAIKIDLQTDPNKFIFLSSLPFAESSPTVKYFMANLGMIDSKW